VGRWEAQQSTASLRATSSGDHGRPSARCSRTVIVPVRTRSR
jgi:hypothetical protein